MGRPIRTTHETDRAATVAVIEPVATCGNKNHCRRSRTIKNRAWRNLESGGCHLCKGEFPPRPHSAGQSHRPPPQTFKKALRERQNIPLASAHFFFCPHHRPCGTRIPPCFLP